LKIKQLNSKKHSDGLQEKAIRSYKLVVRKYTKNSKYKVTEHKAQSAQNY